MPTPVSKQPHAVEEESAVEEYHSSDEGIPMEQMQARGTSLPPSYILSEDAKASNGQHLESVLDRDPSRMSSFRTEVSKDGQLSDGGEDGLKYQQQHHEEVPMTEKELQKIMRKIDLRMLPVISFIFFYISLSGGNLNHAKVAGMTKALHMSDSEYHIALVSSPIAHMLFALPAMWYMQRFGSKKWISILVMMAGICVFLTGFVRRPHQVISFRIMIAILEAGLSPGLHQTITLMYPRRYTQWRFALAGLGGTIGGICGSFIAFALTDIHSRRLEGWRAMFLIEGAITIIAAPLTYWMMPDSIKDCTYLAEDEKVRYEKVRSPTCANEADAGTKMATRKDKFKLFFSPLAEVKTWLVFLLMFCISMSLAALTSNLTVMMQEGFGFKAKRAQVMGTPIRVMSTVLVLVVSWFSDKLERRLLFVVGPVSIGLIGFLGSLLSPSGITRYGFLYLIEIVHIATPAVTMLLTQNIANDEKRGAALGLHGFIGGLTSIIGNSMIWHRDAPRYYRAYSVMLVFCVMALVSCAVLFIYLRRQNQLKKRQIESGEYSDKSKAELQALGDKDPYFQFRY